MNDRLIARCSRRDETLKGLHYAPILNGDSLGELRSAQRSFDIALYGLSRIVSRAGAGRFNNPRSRFRTPNEKPKHARARAR